MPRCRQEDIFTLGPTQWMIWKTCGKLEKRRKRLKNSWRRKRSFCGEESWMNWHWKSWKDKLQPLSSHFTGGGLMRIPLQMCCFIIDISQRVFLSWLLIRCVSPAALIVCLPKICSIKRLLKGASSLISVWQNRVYEIFHDAQRINSIFRLGYVGNCYFSNFCFLFSFFSGAASETRRPHEGPENLPWKSMVSFVWWGPMRGQKTYHGNPW